MIVAPLEGKAQRCAHLCTARINVFEGSVRSGKTFVSLLAWLLFVRFGPAGNLLMVGKTERTLKRNIIDPLIDWLGPKRCRYVQGSGELWLLGRRIYIAGANDERAQDRIRGLTLVGVYVDELTIIPQSFWRMVLTRLSVEGARAFATTNPDSPEHWSMVEYLARATLWVNHDGDVVHGEGDNLLDLHRFSFNLRDNPSLSPAFIEALGREFTGLWRLRFVEGLWVVAEGLIWDTWPEVRIVDDLDLPDMTAHLVGIDYGTHGTHAAVLLGVGTDDRLYVLSEWRWEYAAKHRALTDPEMSTALREWLDECAKTYPGCNEPVRIVVDPSASSLTEQLHRDRWSRVRNANNEVLDGLRSVASLFAADLLRVHESASGLRKEIPNYVWDEDSEVDKPVKKNDHSCDALRYGVMASRRYWRHWLAADRPSEDEDELAAA